MRPVTCHITINGRPYCQKPLTMQMTAGITQCEYGSIAAAKRAKLEIQKHFAGVKIVKGECPAYQGEKP